MMKGYMWVLLLAMTSMECVADREAYLGIHYYETKDYKSALREFLPLANGIDGGDALAQYYLGLMYYNEKGGVPRDYSQAAGLYRKAAEQGLPDAQFYLGVMYEHGEGVKKNLVLAHMLYNLAAVNGEKTAKDNRDGITSQLTPAQLNEAKELASKWVKGQPLPTITKTYPSSSPQEK